jgi:hypothetical protein
MKPKSHSTISSSTGRIPSVGRKTIFLRLLLSPFSFIALCGATSSCATSLRNAELENIAKDWCLVIRASQVIPVYPLTEDVQPGDVLLVRTTIQDQVAEYKARGYLPLDQLLVRLQPTEYPDFYQNAYEIKMGVHPPHHWQFKTQGDLVKADYHSAPRAAFPTYKFSVESGSGINMAIPVQGVPVGLSLLGAGKASGSVTISDAYTFGLDDFVLRKLVEKWASQNAEYLRNFGPRGGAKQYLRVVSRVFLTGGVNITLSHDRAFSGSASGGDPKPVDLLNLQGQNAAENYERVLKAFNEVVDKAIPGGTVKVAAASSRSISLVESFPRPLVIGYLGFDLPIEEDGAVGLPVPIRAHLGETTVLEASKFGPDPNSERIRTWLRVAGNRDQLATWLQQTHDIPRSEIPNVLSGAEHVALREQIVQHFHVP